MLRINLLPAYLAERRKVRAAIVLSALAFLVVTGGGLGYVFGSLNQQVKTTQDLAEAKQAEADKETAYESATAALRTQIQPLVDRVKFVDDIKFHNVIRQKIYRQAVRYTYRKVEYDAMSVAGNTLSISATVSSLSDIARFYILMFGNPDVTAVSITGVPTWADVKKAQPLVIPGGPPPAPPRYRIAMNATLTHSVSPPGLPASMQGGPAGGGGGSSFGGQGSGFGSGPPIGGGGAPNPMGSGGGGPPPMGSGGGGPGPMGSGASGPAPMGSGGH